MKILIHDYAGHPFQVQLSRALAGRGHEITHAYATFLQTPRGSLERRADDPSDFQIHGIGISKPFEKHNFIRRRFQEVEYGRKTAAFIEQTRPDWVISGNTPTEAQMVLLHASHRVGAKFVSWVQDFYGTAVAKLLRHRLPIVGGMIGKYYQALDRRILRSSDRIILITEDFQPFIAKMGIAANRMRVIENWAPLEDLPLRQKNNPWAIEHGLADKFCFLYSGTLGMKHNPSLLSALAERFIDDADVRIVVISEGPGVTWLREEAERKELANLVLMPFQPFESMADVLGCADVLVAILEPDAGVFSVPSKVLTYLCAGKALLTAMPTENLAARIILRAGAGIVVGPNDPTEFLEAGKRIREDVHERERMNIRARKYAENTFSITSIADEFETVLTV